MLQSLAYKCILIFIVFKSTTSEAANVCSRGSPSFVRTANLSPNIKLVQRLQPLSLSAYSCHHHCHREVNCYAYFVHSSSKQCYLITSILASFLRDNFENSEHWDFYKKLCLPVTAENCSRHWVFEKISSFQLFAKDEKIIGEVFTEEQCMDACFVEKSFLCRSARYDALNKRCTLSKYDRRSAPESLKRVNSNQIHYFENQCIQDCETDNVQFELQSGVYFTTQAYNITRDFQPQECLKVCRQDLACRSLNIDYEKNLCEFIGHSYFDSKFLKQNSHFNHFRKVCLKSNTGCNRDWAFERVRGREMVSVPFGKVLVDAWSIEECQAACLDFKPFVCRSADFNHQTNQCKLSPYDRYSSGEKHAKLGLRSVGDYMENNCVQDAKGFCNVKSTKQSRLILADRFLFSEDVQSCEQQCMQSNHFICRSFTYELTTKTCALSHHSKRSYATGALIKSATHTYYEISTCFDVTVECEPDVMLAVINSNTLFQGKVYTRDRPQSCLVDVGNSMQFSLPIQLSGDVCGTATEEEGKFSNVLVIQSNDHVVTAFDKAIGVKCGYDVGNKTGVTALHIKELRLTDRSRSSPGLPDLSLHITDTNGHEREVVNLGELLKVQVRMSDEDTYGIFLRNMIARDESGSNNITLIDQSGCPVEAKMMREVRIVDQQSKSLESYFEAFSFTGSSTLELETEVETCLDKCRPVQCHLVTGRSDDDYETVSSFGKRKRRNVKSGDKPEKGDVLETTKLTKTLAVKSQEFGIGINEPKKGRPVTAPLSKIAINGDRSDDRTNGPKLSKSPFKYVIDEFGYYCFEPSTLATFSGATLIIQGLLFTIALLMATRMKRNKSTTDSSIIFAHKK